MRPLSVWSCVLVLMVSLPACSGDGDGGTSAEGEGEVGGEGEGEGASEGEGEGASEGEGEGASEGEGEGASEGEGEGSGLEPGQCIGPDDCEPEWACRQPDYVEGPNCGIPCEVNRECESDDDCVGVGDGPACLEELGGCCGPGGPLSSRCGPAPTCSEESCGEGYRCKEDGRCEAIPCTDDGWDCGPYSTCTVPPREGEGDPIDTTVGDGDVHGCEPNECETAGDCASDGYCVRSHRDAMGLCYATPGTCREVPLPAPSMGGP